MIAITTKLNEWTQLGGTTCCQSHLCIDDLLALAELGLQPLRLEGGLRHRVVLEVEVAEGVELGDGRLLEQNRCCDFVRKY